jgi:hypothetical protein
MGTSNPATLAVTFSEQNSGDILNKIIHRRKMSKKHTHRHLPTVIFRVLTPCNLAGGYQRSGGKFFQYLHG